MATITAAKPGGDAPAEAEGTGGGKKKKLVLGLVALLLVAGAAYWFLLKPSGEPAEPVPGEVVALEPIQINLAGGHYLRVGIALQSVEGAHKLDGSYALDKLISTFSMQPLDEVIDAEKREEHRQHLVEELDHHYHGEVMDVYFTEFVTQ